MGQLYSAGFTAPAGVNLSLNHDDIGLKAMGAFAGFFFGEGNFAARSGDAVACEDSFSLVFVNLHQWSIRVRRWNGQPVLVFCCLQNIEVYSERDRGARTAPMPEITQRDLVAGLCPVDRDRAECV